MAESSDPGDVGAAADAPVAAEEKVGAPAADSTENGQDSAREEVSVLGSPSREPESSTDVGTDAQDVCLENGADGDDGVDETSTKVMDEIPVVGVRSVKVPPIQTPGRCAPEASTGEEMLSKANIRKIRLLGKGDVGFVFLVQVRGVPELKGQYALKVVKKADIIKRQKVQRIRLEREILAVTNHPFVVSMYAAFQTEKRLYMLLQYCPGGELYRMIKMRPNKRIPEDWARFYIAEILLGVEYLHLLGYIYRDLKPENILLHASGHVMLADFDLAKNQAVLSEPHSPLVKASPRRRTRTRSGSNNSTPVAATSSTTGCCCCRRLVVDYPMLDTEAHLEGSHSDPTKSFVGTYDYLAPEIIKMKGYTGTVDWWMLGVLLYEMVYGTAPFKGSTPEKTIANIFVKDIVYPTDIPVSKHCIDIIQRLLEKEVEDRLKAPDDIRAHKFFSGLQWSLIRDMEPPFIPVVENELDTRNFRHISYVDTDSDVELEENGESDSEPAQEQKQSAVSGDDDESTVIGAAKSGTEDESEAHEKKTSGEADDSDDGEEGVISIENASFVGFDYFDPKGERHWDLKPQPTRKGLFDHLKDDHVESPRS